MIQESEAKHQNKNRQSKGGEDDYVLEIFKLNNTAPAKKENICRADCGKETGELVECRGVCHGHFHLDCAGAGASQEQFKCNQCTSGLLWIFFFLPYRNY